MNYYMKMITMNCFLDTVEIKSNWQQLLPAHTHSGYEKSYMSGIVEMRETYVQNACLHWTYFIHAGHIAAVSKIVPPWEKH